MHLLATTTTTPAINVSILRDGVPCMEIPLQQDPQSTANKLECVAVIDGGETLSIRTQISGLQTDATVDYRFEKVVRYSFTHTAQANQPPKHYDEILDKVWKHDDKPKASSIQTQLIEPSEDTSSYRWIHEVGFIEVDCWIAPGQPHSPPKQYVQGPSFQNDGSFCPAQQRTRSTWPPNILQAGIASHRVVFTPEYTLRRCERRFANKSLMGNRPGAQPLVTFGIYLRVLPLEPVVATPYQSHTGLLSYDPSQMTMHWGSGCSIPPNAPSALAPAPHTGSSAYIISLLNQIPPADRTSEYQAALARLAPSHNLSAPVPAFSALAIEPASIHHPTNTLPGLLSGLAVSSFSATTTAPPTTSQMPAATSQAGMNPGGSSLGKREHEEMDVDDDEEL